MAFSLDMQAEISLESFLNQKSIIDITPVPIVVSTASEPSVYLYCNQSYVDLVGYARERIETAALVDSAAIADQARDERLSLLAEHGGYRSAPSRLRHVSGQPVEVIISAQRLLLGGQACDIEVMTDIGGVIQSYQRQLADAQAAATTDGLTGILNRQGFEAALTRHRLALRAETDLAIGLIDLDGFKQINDRHGHLIGDLVLRDFARRLAASLGPDAELARFGGDEFVVLMPIAREGKWTCEGRLFARLEQALADFQVSGIAIELGASLGVAYASEAAWIVEEAILLADRRMYMTKKLPGTALRSILPPMI